MRRAGLTALAGLAIILAGLIALETRRPALPQRAGAVIPAFQSGPSTAGGAADPTAAWVAGILARPLFDPSRRPPAAAARAAPAAAVLPRLAGIMVTPAARDAVFMPASGPPIVAGPGGQVGAFTVRSIDAETVTVTGPHGLAVLHTSFDDGAPHDEAAPPPASPFSVIDGITGTPGGVWLDNGKADLPNAATWPGLQPLSRLPAAPAAPASSPLLPSGSSG